MNPPLLQNEKRMVENHLLSASKVSASITFYVTHSSRHIKCGEKTLWVQLLDVHINQVLWFESVCVSERTLGRLNYDNVLVIMQTMYRLSMMGSSYCSIYSTSKGMKHCLSWHLGQAKPSHYHGNPITVIIKNKNLIISSTVWMTFRRLSLLEKQAIIYTYKIVRMCSKHSIYAKNVISESNTPSYMLFMYFIDAWENPIWQI